MEAYIDAQGGETDGTALVGPDATLSAIAMEDARILGELARAVEDDLARPDLTASTERAYDWADFATFCRRHSLEALPAAPQTLALYLKSLETKTNQSLAGLRQVTAGLSISTLRRRLAAIASKHATEKLETPTVHPLVKKLVRRYCRSRGTAVKKKDALTIERLPAILLAMPDDLLALRDQALLLLCYAGAFRRNELVALDVDDRRSLAPCEREYQAKRRKTTLQKTPHSCGQFDGKTPLLKLPHPCGRSALPSGLNVPHRCGQHIPHPSGLKPQRHRTSAALIRTYQITKNQQHQDAAASVVGELLQKNDRLADAIAALQRVGVNVMG